MGFEESFNRYNMGTSRVNGSKNSFVNKAFVNSPKLRK